MRKSHKALKIAISILAQASLMATAIANTLPENKSSIDVATQALTTTKHFLPHSLSPFNTFTLPISTIESEIKSTTAQTPKPLKAPNPPELVQAGSSTVAPFIVAKKTLSAESSIDSLIKQTEVSLSSAVLARSSIQHQQPEQTSKPIEIKESLPEPDKSQAQPKTSNQRKIAFTPTNKETITPKNTVKESQPHTEQQVKLALTNKPSKNENQSELLLQTTSKEISKTRSEKTHEPFSIKTNINKKTVVETAQNTETLNTLAGSAAEHFSEKKKESLSTQDKKIKEHPHSAAQTQSKASSNKPQQTEKNINNTSSKKAAPSVIANNAALAVKAPQKQTKENLTEETKNQGLNTPPENIATTNAIETKSSIHLPPVSKEENLDTAAGAILTSPESTTHLTDQSFSWHQGEMLRQALTRWTKQAGYQRLVWQVKDQDGDLIEIPIAANHTFKNNFLDTIRKVKRAYATAPSNPILLDFIIKQGNKTIIVTNLRKTNTP